MGLGLEFDHLLGLNFDVVGSNFLDFGPRFLRLLFLHIDHPIEDLLPGDFFHY